ncbi:hypothetical protein [Mycetocola sp. JXN-3]|uniref:hypothetical protein n=1 Tax=Mycetocola sp. JXN-3 TaxID=2116510 RepID=UPI00165D0B40|nr:hypothetical protein [Mycetocola sp. JXN-3]
MLIVGTLSGIVTLVTASLILLDTFSKLALLSPKALALMLGAALAISLVMGFVEVGKHIWGSPKYGISRSPQTKFFRSFDCTLLSVTVIYGVLPRVVAGFSTTLVMAVGMNTLGVVVGLEPFARFSGIFLHATLVLVITTLILRNAVERGRSRNLHLAGTFGCLLGVALSLGVTLALITRSAPQPGDDLPNISGLLSEVLSVLGLLAITTAIAALIFCIAALKRIRNQSFTLHTNSVPQTSYALWRKLSKKRRTSSGAIFIPLLHELHHSWNGGVLRRTHTILAGIVVAVAAYRLSGGPVSGLPDGLRPTVMTMTLLLALGMASTVSQRIGIERISETARSLWELGRSATLLSLGIATANLVPAMITGLLLSCVGGFLGQMWAGSSVLVMVTVAAATLIASVLFPGPAAVDGSHMPSAGGIVCGLALALPAGLPTLLSPALAWILGGLYLLIVSGGLLLCLNYRIRNLPLSLIK